MAKTVRPFLLFQGQAQEAMNFYVSLFPESKVTDVVRWGPGQAGRYEGIFLRLLRIEEKIARLYASLVEAGRLPMPLNDYSFSRQLGWVNDRGQ